MLTTAESRAPDRMNLQCRLVTLHTCPISWRTDAVVVEGDCQDFESSWRDDTGRADIFEHPERCLNDSSVSLPNHIRALAQTSLPRLRRIISVAAAKGNAIVLRDPSASRKTNPRKKYWRVWSVYPWRGRFVARSGKDYG